MRTRGMLPSCGPPTFVDIQGRAIWGIQGYTSADWNPTTLVVLPRLKPRLKHRFRLRLVPRRRPFVVLGIRRVLEQSFSGLRRMSAR